MPLPLPQHRRENPVRVHFFLHVIGLALFTALCLLITGAFCDPPPIGWTTPAKIVRVIDGDTVEVEITRRINVRLDRCWAPESRTKDGHEKQLGLAAKANLETLLSGHSVTLHVPADADESLSGIFTLSRVVGTLWTPEDPRSINQRQVDNGYAWPTKAEQQAAVAASRVPTPSSSTPQPRKAKP